jgi:hypothetical protein
MLAAMSLDRTSALDARAAAVWRAYAYSYFYTIPAPADRT